MKIVKYILILLVLSISGNFVCQSLESKLELKEGNDAYKKGDFKKEELYAKVLQSKKMGNKQTSEELVLQMVTNYGDKPYLIAISFAGIGENIKALDWLEKSHSMKDKELVYVNVEPMFKELRNMDRFNNLINKMNFPK